MASSPVDPFLPAKVLAMTAALILSLWAVSVLCGITSIEIWVNGHKYELQTVEETLLQALGKVRWR